MNPHPPYIRDPAGNQSFTYNALTAYITPSKITAIHACSRCAVARRTAAQQTTNMPRMVAIMDVLRMV